MLILSFANLLSADDQSIVYYNYDILRQVESEMRNDSGARFNWHTSGPDPRVPTKSVLYNQGQD